MLWCTLAVWGFTSDGHPLFQIPNSSPVLYLYCIHFLRKEPFFPENRNDNSSWVPSKPSHHLSPIILGMNPWIFVIVNLWIVKTFCPSFKRFISIKTRLIDGVAQFNIDTYCRPLPVHLVLGLLLLGVHRWHLRRRVLYRQLFSDVCPSPSTRKIPCQNCLGSSSWKFLHFVNDWAFFFLFLGQNDQYVTEPVEATRTDGNVLHKK